MNEVTTLTEETKKMDLSTDLQTNSAEINMKHETSSTNEKETCGKNDSSSVSTIESTGKSDQSLSVLEQLKLLPEPPSLSKEPIILKLRELNPYITCALCGGYMYEASTITECMHTFCKTCIVRHTERHLCCPTCDTPIHPTDPFVHIRHDSTLQDIVYRLLPKVAEEEERREKLFCEKYEKETGEQLLPRLQLPPPPPKTPPPTADRPPLPSEVIRKKKEKEVQLGNFQSQFVSLLLQQISEEEDGDEYFDMEKKFVRVTQKATIGNVANFIRKKLHLGNIYDVDVFHTSQEDDNIQILETSTTLQYLRDSYYGGQDVIMDLQYRVTPKEEEMLEYVN